MINVAGLLFIHLPYLHIYFSLALIIKEIWKSYISVRENTRL